MPNLKVRPLPGLGGTLTDGAVVGAPFRVHAARPAVSIVTSARPTDLMATPPSHHPYATHRGPRGHTCWKCTRSVPKGGLAKTSTPASSADPEGEGPLDTPTRTWGPYVPRDGGNDVARMLHVGRLVRGTGCVLPRQRAKQSWVVCTDSSPCPGCG